MESNERIAVLEANGRWQNKILEEIQKDIKKIVEWRWKMWSVTAVVSAICTGLFELLLAMIHHN